MVEFSKRLNDGLQYKSDILLARKIGSKWFGGLVGRMDFCNLYLGGLMFQGLYLCTKGVRINIPGKRL